MADPEVMNTDWPVQHGRAWFEALLGDPVWALPGHRGAGVGGLLVDAFLDWARERGAPYTLRTPL